MCGASSQRGQRVQSVKRSGVDRGDLVVVERQEAHRAQPDKAAVAHAADPVAPQHAVDTSRSILLEANARRRGRSEGKSVMWNEDVPPKHGYLLR